MNLDIFDIPIGSPDEDRLNGSNWTTAATASTSVLKLTDIIEAIETIKDKAAELRKITDTNWILISPRGEVYKGTVQQLVTELMKYHPLLNGHSRPTMGYYDTPHE